MSGTFYAPLSRQISRLGNLFHEKWAVSETIADKALFVSFSGAGRLSNATREQLVQVLRDEQLVFEWQVERKVRSEDPDLADNFNGDLLKNAIELAASLPESLFAQAMAVKGSVTVPISNLGEDLQQKVMTSLDGLGAITSTGPDGVERVAFRTSDVLSKGTMRVFSRRDRENNPTIFISVYTDDPDTASTIAPLMYVSFPENAPEREAIAARKTEEIEEALKGSSKVKKVTIRKESALETDKAPLKTYLTEFVAQTGLDVIASWPNPQPAYQKRLSRSIFHKSHAEALNTLCREYNCIWKWEGKTVLVKPRPPVLRR